MFSWLQKMREKPTSHRRLVAFGIAFLSTGLVFVVWLSTWLPGSLHDRDVSVQNNTQFDSPKDTFLENAASIWTGITGNVSQLKQTVSSASLLGSIQYQATTTDMATSSEIQP